MGRYKSRASIKTIERDYPHVVEILVLEGGLGKLLDAAALSLKAMSLTPGFKSHQA